MSSLAEIEQAIDRLPESEVGLLAAWLERRRTAPPAPPAFPAREPDFLERARRIWGNPPPGDPLSQLISSSRD